jgi:hypothetical protein
MAKQSSTKRKVAAAFHEVYSDVPKNVKKTGKTGEAKRKMMTAIALSKARAAGADVPSMARGGIVPATGVYNMHKGEEVVPAPAAPPGTSFLGSPIAAPDAFTGNMPSA